MRHPNGWCCKNILSLSFQLLFYMKQVFHFPIAVLIAGVAAIALFAFSFAPSPKKPAEAPMPMCHDISATEAFAAFANDQNFLAAHPSPLPVELVGKGKMIEFPVAGGAVGHGYLVKASKKTNKYLLVFQEWWGLNDYVKNEAAMWSKELGINVLAIDLYDGKIATTPEDAGKLMQANDPARSSALILGAAKHLGEKADFRTLGWCFGGGWSLQAALLLKEKTKACVVYYGMPEKEVSKLKTLASDVIFIHPKKDQWINDPMVNEFEVNMKAAGKTVKVYHYDADHAFANPSSPRYNESAAKESRAVVKSYLTGK
jgi:carboxymethylenebutenolidase